MFWGLIYHIQVLKVEVPDSNPLLLREKLGVLSSLPILGHHSGGWVYSKIVSRPLLLNSSGIFLVCPVCRSHSASFWSFFRGIVPYVAVESVCLWEEASLESSYIASLSQNLCFLNCRDGNVNPHIIKILYKFIYFQQTYVDEN